MKYLVIGGYGFLGRHFLSYIAPRKSHTTITRKAPTDASIQGDYILANDLSEKVIAEIAFSHDVLVHMATSSVPASGSIVSEIYDNLFPTIELIRKLSAYNPNLKVVYMSSGGQVYGNKSSARIKESEIREPISAYGYGKLMVENSLEFLARSEGLKVAILRVSNPIGKFQNRANQGIVNVAYNSLINSKPLTIFGDGTEERDYIDADVVAKVIDDVAHTDFSFDVWNVGSGIGTSLNCLLNEIEKITGRKIEVNYSNRRKVDPVKVILDVSKIEQYLGYSLNTDLPTLLRKVLTAKKLESNF